MKKKNDLVLRVIKGLPPFWNIVIFGYVWALYYNDRTWSNFWVEAMAISMILFLVIYLAFGKLYHAFKIGTYRVGELVLSQLLSFGIADLCLYLECCLMHRGMVSILPGIVAVTLQLSGSALLILLAKGYFIRYVPPKDTLFIYGGNREMAEVFEKKIRCRLPHMFTLQISCAEDDTNIENLLKAVRRQEAVLLYHVSGHIRTPVIAEGIRQGKSIYTTPKIEDILLTNFENRHIVDTPLLKAGVETSEYLGKRFLDILFSSLILLLCLPLVAVIALGIRLEDGGPVFYKQKRATKDGKVFEILKFRSMIPDAEKYGAKACRIGDERITRVGRVIRPLRLDEIPQLINILRGDMSVVGPRPERIEHVEKYTEELPEFAYRLRVRGGLTGYAQIYGKYNTSAEDKLKMDLMYIERQSLLLDLQLIFLTLKIIFIPESTEGFAQERGKEDACKHSNGMSK